jgi:branched-chain amino acid transport system ATP-binding protein/sulfate-transporting ATPase
MAAMSALLEVQGLSKHFGGVLALDELNLTVAANEILGLIGPNGSGKTTFFNVITGIYRVDAGSVFFNGADVTNASGRAMYQAGMARTFQRSRLSLPLSIFDAATSSASSRKATRLREHWLKCSSRASPIVCSSQLPACP